MNRTHSTRSVRRRTLTALAISAAIGFGSVVGVGGAGLAVAAPVPDSCGHYSDSTTTTRGYLWLSLIPI